MMALDDLVLIFLRIYGAYSVCTDTACALTLLQHRQRVLLAAAKAAEQLGGNCSPRIVFRKQA